MKRYFANTVLLADWNLASSVLNTFNTWLFLPGLRSRWAQNLVLGSADNVRSSLPQNSIIDLILDAGCYITKEIRVPKSAKANFAQVVTVQVQQNLPKRGVDFEWTYRKTGDDSGVQIATAYIAKKSFIKATETALEQRKNTVRSVSIRTERGRLIPLWSIQSRTDRPVLIWSAISLITLLALIGSFALSEQKELSSLRAMHSDLKLKNSELTQALVAAKDLEANRETLQNDIETDLDLLSSQRSRLQHLASLTDTLSDQTWLSELSIEGSKLRMSGFSKRSIPDLIDRIQALDWVRHAELDGPIMFDSFQRSNRFDLVLSLAPEGQSLK